MKQLINIFIVNNFELHSRFKNKGDQTLNCGACSASIWHFLTVIFLLTISSIECNKLVEVNPPITSINGGNVFNEDGSAIAVLTGIYTNMSNANIAFTTGWLTNICFTTGLTGDELKLYNKSDKSLAPYFENEIPTIESTWANIYKIIFITNSAIEQLPAGHSLTPSIRNQLLGEAKFLRAFCYFYLVNIYGDVPMALSSDYKVNRMLPRTSSSIVYQQIVSDLKDAQNLLNINYLGNNGIDITNERIRPTKWAAAALLARVYLYEKNYNDAEIQANSVIDNSLSYDLVDLNSVFLMNNKEAIWQLQPVGVPGNKTANTREGQLFKLSSIQSSTFYIVYLSDNLVKSFDIRDQRKVNWIDSVIVNGTVYYFPNKYKIGLDDQPTKEYSTILRLGEQYLIRAEARIRQNKISDGISDLNRIRARATNSLVPASDQLVPLSSNLSQEEALLALENERKFELFTEWGHRWLDLKRTNRIDPVLSSEKVSWQTTDQLFPIPQNELDQDPNMRGHQNPGYN
jgi:hypothetical protein